jgi:hypothetical protein
MGIDEKTLGIGMNQLDISGASFFFLTPPFFLDIETSLVVFYQVALRFSLFASKRKNTRLKLFRPVPGCRKIIYTQKTA